MHQSIGFFVACVLCLGACNFENYEDCKGEDDLELDDDFEGGHSRAGRAPIGGSESTNGGSTSTGATPSEGGTTPAEPVEPVEPPATPCEVEHDCPPGFNCDLEALVCSPADAETCGELLAEEECTARTDCTPIYGGTNCSCGADCQCMGGEPGCICEEFGFVVCR